MVRGQIWLLLGTLFLSSLYGCGALLNPSPLVGEVELSGGNIAKDSNGVFSITSGEIQTLKFKIEVKDSEGNVLPYEKINWKVASGSGNFSNSETTSDALGFAENTFLPPTSAQSINLAISTRNKTQQLTLQVKAGPLHALEFENPPSIQPIPLAQKNLNESLGTYTFKAVDENGNAVSDTKIYLNLLNAERVALFLERTSDSEGRVQFDLPRVAKDGLYQFVIYGVGAKTQSSLRKRLNVRVRSLGSSTATENLGLRNNTSAPLAYYMGALNMDLNADGHLDLVEIRAVDDGSPSGATQMISRIRDPQGLWSQSFSQIISTEIELNWKASSLISNAQAFLINPIFGLWNTRGDGRVEHLSWNSLIQQYETDSTKTILTTEGDANMPVRILDLNLDGYLDYVGVLNSSNNARIAIHYGGPNGVAHTQSVPIAGDCPISPLMGDFDGDGLADMINISQNCGSSYWIRRNLQTSNTSLWSDFSASTLINSTNDFWPVLADLDADGHLDFVTNATHHTALVMYGNTDGSFSAASNPSTPRFGMFSDSYTFVHDINADGAPDLVYRDMGAGTLRWVRNLGNRSFHTTSSVWMSTGDDVMDVHVSDLDGNGSLDGVLLSIDGGFAPLNIQYHFGSP